MAIAISEVEWKEFIRAWMKGGRREAASVCKITEEAATMRATALRKAGVALPKSGKYGCLTAHHVDELNEYIVELRGGKKRK